MNKILVMIGMLGVTKMAFSSFNARLYFENLTRGTSNAGSLLTAPGDQLAIHFHFAGSGSAPNKWGIIQMVLCDSPVLAAADADTWATQFSSVVPPASDFLHTQFIGDSNLYDHANDATDNTTPFVCHGSYGNFGVNSQKSRAMNWDVVLFQFTAAGSPGDVLDWYFDGRDTVIGLATLLITNTSLRVDYTDNHVLIVPEGGGGSMFGFGAMASMAVECPRKFEPIFRLDSFPEQEGRRLEIEAEQVHRRADRPDSL